MSRGFFLGTLVAAVSAVSGCAPDAIYFHEATKVGFDATYNTADSEPVSAHFGYKRRIIAVVPAQDRAPAADGNQWHDTNKGESLALVSKFYVRTGTLREGVVIRNNFATGEAARVLTRAPDAGASVRALVHNQTVTVAPNIDASGDAAPAQAIAARIARIQMKKTDAKTVPVSRSEVSRGVKMGVVEPETPPPTDAPPVSTREVSGHDHTVKKIATPAPATPPPAGREVSAHDRKLRPTASPAPGATPPPPAGREVGRDRVISPTGR